MLSRNKCVIKIDISLFLAVQTLSGSVNSIVCDRNEFNTKKTTLQGLWFHVPSLNRTNGISIYLINKVAPKQKYQRRKRNKSESKTFMFHGGKTARTRTQSWRAAVHCRVRLKRRERPSAVATCRPMGPMLPAAPTGPLSLTPRGSRWSRIFLGYKDARAPSPGRPSCSSPRPHTHGPNPVRTLPKTGWHAHGPAHRLQDRDARRLGPTSQATDRLSPRLRLRRYSCSSMSPQLRLVASRPQEGGVPRLAAVRAGATAPAPPSLLPGSPSLTEEEQISGASSTRNSILGLVRQRRR